MSSVDSLKDSALSDASSQYWEKTLTDMNNVDESFANARDLGYSRLNYSRLTAIGTLAKVDKVDIYKTNVISNRGQVSISVRTGGEDSKVLDLSTYETYLNQLKQQTDPEGYEKEKAEKKKEQAEKSSLELTAPGVRIEVYSTNRQGKQVLVADSAEDEGSELRENLELMLTGEYEASKGTYYIKISRDETVDSDEEMPYALQIKNGRYFQTRLRCDRTALGRHQQRQGEQNPPDYVIRRFFVGCQRFADSGFPLSGDGSDAASRLSKYGKYLFQKQ